MPKLIISALLALAVLALLPPAVIARARTRPQAQRRIHLVQDMDNQARRNAQEEDPFFKDRRAMRPVIEGTVARGELGADRHREEGVVGEAWATGLPASLPPTRALLERGHERFTIYCAPCHGQAGYGDGIVHKRATELMNNPLLGNGTVWVQPKSMHDPTVRDQPIGQIFSTISLGIRNMSGYAAQIPVDDRWAIAAFVKALQRSQSAPPSDVPAGVRAGLPLTDLRTPAAPVEPAPAPSATAPPAEGSR